MTNERVKNLLKWSYYEDTFIVAFGDSQDICSIIFFKMQGWCNEKIIDPLLTVAKVVHKSFCMN